MSEPRPISLAYWHRLPGTCNHLASEIGGECGRAGEGTWTPLFACGPCQAGCRPPAPTSKELSLAEWFKHYHGDTEFSGHEVASIIRGAI